MTARYRLAVACGWLAVVWLTTHWYSWNDTIGPPLHFGDDMREYERVAKAAPHFPADALPSQHANRFVPHYVVGLVSDALHVGVRPVYYVCAFLLLAALLVVVDRLVAPLATDRIAYALCIGALVANPYLYRYLAICPARLADTVFMIGGAAALLGLLRGNPWLLVGGLVVAMLGRSESVFPLLVLAPAGVLVSRDWEGRRSQLTAAAAFVVPLVTYALIVVGDDSFSKRDHPGFWELTIFGVLRDLPGSAHELAAHSLRVISGVVGGLALIAGALVARRRRQVGRPLGFAFWAAIFAGVAVSAEAWILSPEFIFGNSPLLSALGAAFFVVAAAAAFQGLALRLTAGAVALGGLAVISLHHRFSEISPVSTPGQYGALAAFGAAVAAVAIAAGRAP